MLCLVAGVQLASARLPVFQIEDPEALADWPCVGGGGRDGTCSEQIDVFLERADYLAPGEDLFACSARLRQSLADQARSRDAGVEPDWLPSGSDVLGEEIPKVLGIGALRHLAGESYPVARLVGSEETPLGRRDFLFIDDLAAGTVPGVLALPPAAHARPQLPVVVGLPGHESTAQGFLDEYGGPLLERGIAVLAVGFAGYGADADETLATTALLCAGSSLLAHRVLSAHAALAYLRHRDMGGRFTAVGLMGHSGGGSVASLLAWYAEGIDGVATDHPSFFFDVALPDDPGGPALQVLDETHPELARLALGIRDLEQAPIPVHVAPYGYGLDPAHPAPTTYPEFFAGLLFR